AVGADATKPDDGTPKPESRVVVYGDSDFAANSSINLPGNKDLYMNTIGWLSQQENLISIRPKNPEDRPLTLTAAQQNNIMLLSLLVVPGLFLGSGVFSWWRRRWMRGVKSTIALLVVLAGLGAYAYFVTSKLPEGSTSDTKKLFEGIAIDKI